jgi:hypothetical protein
LEGEEALKYKKVHKAKILSYMIEDSTKHMTKLQCCFSRTTLVLKRKTRRQNPNLPGKNKSIEI